MINAVSPVHAVEYRRYRHPFVPERREEEAGNVVMFDPRFRCPPCDRALSIDYGTISCMPCGRHGDPEYWVKQGIRLQKGV